MLLLIFVWTWDQNKCYFQKVVVNSVCNFKSIQKTIKSPIAFEIFLKWQGLTLLLLLLA